MRPIKEAIADHQGEDTYITDEMIRHAIFEGPQVPQPIGLLKLREIENLLDSNGMTEESEIFYTFGRMLSAKVGQR